MYVCMCGISIYMKEQSLRQTRSVALRSVAHVVDDSMQGVTHLVARCMNTIIIDLCMNITHIPTNIR